MTQTLQLPYVYDWQAPREWACIDLLSDVHLHEDDPDTAKAWAWHMEHSEADAILILGDLFEAWVGDDAAHHGFARWCVEVLCQVSARKTIGYMVGNRDFLAGADLLQACGMMALPDPTRLSAWGQYVLLSHGDLLCTGDVEYQAFRKTVRSEAWRNQFLAQPLKVREAQARAMRQASQSAAAKRLQLSGTPVTDIDAATAVAWMHQSACDVLVHGHTHQPQTEVLAPGYTRHVLSDWDARATPPRREVLRLTRDGLHRHAMAVE